MWVAVWAVVFVGLSVAIAVFGAREEMRPAVMGERLVSDFRSEVMREVDDQLLELGPLLAACCEDDRQKLSREFGTAVYYFYWDAVDVAEFREVCASIIEAADARRVWF